MARLAPDLIILDAVLAPGQDGWLLLQQLKTSLSTASIPVLICTDAVSDAERWHVYFEAKGINILLKPFEIDHLLTTVRRTLSGCPTILPFSTWRQTRPHLLG